jgi:hypothetical protein
MTAKLHHVEEAESATAPTTVSKNAVLKAEWHTPQLRKAAIHIQTLLDGEDLDDGFEPGEGSSQLILE